MADSDERLPGVMARLEDWIREGDGAGDIPRRVGSLGGAAAHLAAEDPPAWRALVAADPVGLGPLGPGLARLLEELGKRIPAEEVDPAAAAILGAIRGACDALARPGAAPTAELAQEVLRRQLRGMVRELCQAPAPREPISLPPAERGDVEGAGSGIHEYVDYRAYLRDWLNAEGRPSQRALAARIGASPPMLSAVLSAERDLSAFKAELLADEVTEGPRDRQYFLDMVEYNQPGPLTRRTAAFDRMASLRTFRGAQRLTSVDRAWMVFRHWYVPVILELTTVQDYVEDPRWMAERLQPPITPEQAADAVRALGEAGLLHRDAAGRLAPAAPVQATDHEVRRATGLAVGAWHLWLLERAAVVLDTLPASERYFGGLCMAVSDETLAELRTRTKAFTEACAAAAARSTDGRNRVYQLSVQLMPLTTRS